MSSTDYLTLAETYLKTGTKLYNEKNYEEALFYFEQVLEYNPNSTTTLYYKGTQFEFGLGVSKEENKAFECYEKGGRLGHGECSFRTGLMYLEGRGVEKNESSAFEWFKFAADIGSTAAQIQISHFFQHGIVVSHNCDIAINWLLKAANDGKINKVPEEARNLFYLIGEFYYHGHDDFHKDFDRAKYWYEKAAALDHPESQLCLGYMYQHGEHVDINFSQALRWYEKASNHDKTSGSAFYNIGLLYQEGHDTVQQNLETCFLYFLQAAMNGHAKSQFKVALKYQKGEGVEKDYSQAYIWYTNLDENKNNPLNQYNIGYLYKTGDGGDFKKDLSLAFHWFCLAAEQGYEDAQTRVGMMYQHGEGVEKDYHKAHYWYTKTESNLQDPLIQYNMGKLYLLGYDTFEKDLENAFTWFKKSADQGDVDAQLQIGAMYHNGQHVAKNYTEAQTWYMKVLEQSQDDFALLNLGKLYFFGHDDFKKDEQLALYYYQLAADKGNNAAALQLGVMYQNGIGVAVDYTTALEWYLKINQDSQNAGLANYNIGQIYYYQLRDYTTAFDWYTKGAQKNDCESQYMLGLMYLEGHGVEKNQSTAIEWFNTSSENGSNKAKYALASMYQTGEGLPTNNELALKLYQEILKTEEHGDAYNNIGYMYQHGLANLPQDYNMAMDYYLRADALNCNTAACSIGSLYLNGYGVEKDEAKAFEWQTKSMENGCTFAIFELAKMYFYGQHVAKDHTMAAKLFDKALKKGMKVESVQVFLNMIQSNEENFTIINTIQTEDKDEPILDMSELSSELKALIQEEDLENEKKLLELEEKLRLQNLQMEQLIHMNKSSDQGKFASRVEPFHLVLPNNDILNQNYPSYKENKIIDVDDEDMVFVTSSKNNHHHHHHHHHHQSNIDLISGEPTVMNIVLSPTFEQPNLLSFDTIDNNNVNTKPDVVDDSRVFVHKPNEIDEPCHDLSVGNINQEDRAYLIETVVRKTSISNRVSLLEPNDSLNSDGDSSRAIKKDNNNTSKDNSNASIRTDNTSNSSTFSLVSTPFLGLDDDDDFEEFEPPPSSF